MDSHAHSEHSQPITPADLPLVPPNEPPPAPPPESLSGWFAQNWSKLLVMVAIFVVICRYLHPLDVLLAGFGLSLIIFLHELGHFLAAKWCDVHVRTFSIGFGPALPFCQFKYGETTYKVAMIPLGGYVAMVGESEEDGEPETDLDDHDNDPRSFRNKTVGQRMLIISAGVIMNILLGCACFVATYMHGVQEKPAVASGVEPGSAAWVAGLPTGTEITSIDGRKNPWFDDLRPTVSSTNEGETVDLDVVFAGNSRHVVIEPTRPEGALFPVLGIVPPRKLELIAPRRNDTTPPYLVGSAAAAAKGADGGPGFQPGDKLVAMTDPANPTQVTEFNPTPNGLPGAYFDYVRRLAALAGKPVTVQVRRNAKAGQDGDLATLTVPPAFHKSVGLRMRMGPVTAIRTASSAAEVVQPADRITEIEIRDPSGDITRFVAGQPTTDSGEKVTIKPIDPMRMPDELNWWSDRWLADRTVDEWKPEDRVVRIKVLRQNDADHTEKPLPLELTWDPIFRYEQTEPSTPGSPVPLTGLGVGYQVDRVVDAIVPDSPAAKAGLQPNDQITEVRFTATDHQGTETTGSWQELEPNQWGFVENLIQQNPTFEVKLKRNGTPVTAKLTAEADPSWPIPEQGLAFAFETRTQKADGVLEALQMGVDRTARSIKMVYLGLYSMVFGRISVKMMSGPLTLARASYFIAGEDVWTLLLWIGLISVNLAVVNFLPIPVLDGGHMVFLLYEWLRGKPAPIFVQALLTYVGLGLIACLMLFVIGLDVWRLFFA